ncbi:MAG: AAA family ATPase [Gemmatimonadetes bacterium]|nr:AAA family ATPase [Gemmatimonadota bacterium]
MRGDHFLRLCGAPVLHDPGGQPVALRTKKQLGLLVYLALEARARPVSRDALADLLWADVAGDRARHSLAQALTAIRNLLGVESLTRGGDRVMLRAGLETDLDRLRAGVTGIDLRWPLSGVEHWAGTEFAHWVEGARTRCSRAAVDTLLESMRRLRSSGASQRVYECAGTLYRLDPLSDVAIHALAEAALVKGDVVGAIRMLREHIRQVKAELKCNPHPDVARLLKRLEAGAHPPVETVPAGLAAEGRHVRRSVFVGRESELARLEAEWEAACAGQLRTCLVVGPGGIGKTSLVRRFATALSARAFPVFFVSCQEIGHGIPFAALADLINALCRDPSLSATDPIWLAEASRVNPALKAMYPGIPSPPSAPAESIRIRVAEAMLHMLETVADGKPFALIFDDVQHMDPATRDVLFVVEQRLAQSAALLLTTQLTLKDWYGDAASSSAWRQASWKQIVRLGPLSNASVSHLIAKLATELAPTDPVRTKIADLAEGNPYFVEMLVSDWEHHRTSSLVATDFSKDLPRDWTPPDTLRTAFARLYDGVGERARTVLQVLAVAKRRLTTEEIAMVLGSSTSYWDVVALELLNRGILRVDNAQLSFKNDLHRAYAYCAMAEDTRRFYHAKLAQALRSSGRTRNTLQQSIEVGFHFLDADCLSAGERAILEGSRIAIHGGAPREAEAALRVLIRRRGDSLGAEAPLLLAEAISALGRYRETLETLTKLNRTWRSAESPLAVILEAEALHRTRLADDTTIIAKVEHAVRLADETGDDSLLSRAVQISTEVASETGQSRMLRTARQLVAKLELRTQSTEGRGRALLTKGYWLLAAGELDHAATAFLDAIPLLRKAALEPERARALNGLGLCYISLGRHQQGQDILRQTLQVLENFGDRDHRGTIWNNLGVAYEEVGMIDAAAKCYDKAVVFDSVVATPRRLAVSHTNAGDAAIILGDFQAAEEHLAQARAAADASGLWRLTTGVDLAEADLLIARGDTELAWPLVQRAVEVTRDRYRAIDARGRFKRLQLYHVWSTQGRKAAANSIRASGSLEDGSRLADRLEVAAFCEWVEASVTEEPQHSPVLAEIAAAGLFGVIARLAAVHIILEERVSPLPGESCAAMLDRVFPVNARPIQLHDLASSSSVGSSAGRSFGCDIELAACIASTDVGARHQHQQGLRTQRHRY